MSLRRHDRHPLTGKVWLSWESGGQPTQVSCQGVDISVSGMRVSSTDPVPTGLYASFRMQGTAFAGVGSIRSCQRDRMKYIIGIEFGQGVRWDPERFPLANAPKSA